MRRLATLFDPFIALLIGTVTLAALLPVTGAAADAVGTAASVGVGLLFFLYGARLSTGEALDGLRHWRLHLTVLLCTFALFPLLGLAAGTLVPHVLTEQLWHGLLFLCVVPSTIQSSIAFTSLARGNVPAAICAGTYSSLLGMVLTPLLAALLIGTTTGFTADGLLGIATQLLAPFLAGQLLRRRIGGFVARHRARLSLVDRGAILLVVYAAFSRGVADGVWGQLEPWRLAALLGVEVVLLTVMLTLTTYGSRALGFDRDDRIAIVFAGSKKSLAAGLPMAAVLFGPQTSLAVLPLMLFHQLQLMVCAVLARRASRRAPLAQDPEPGRPRRSAPA
ncbi:bile acid:sodium symporter [Streptomyces sp. JJ66]|uniref:bile acid:sodium symporter family protein n=1 Tax=Streptomyces sp. JJ66 TaxID=2803843 RepID=UPI001C5655E5|nr:bile acid:sodium symporter family protein [Streptomyces sp. JJ66]MBW1600527.1 bile acid:sodium symporter [Streptomyces sp. JJ66]